MASFGFPFTKRHQCTGTRMKKTGISGRERGHLIVDDLKRRVCKRQSQTVLGDAVTGQGATGTNCSMESFDEI